MEFFSPTPAERRWCRDTIVRIVDYLPRQYSLVAQARLKKKGIEVSTRYIIDCKNMLRHDPRVVEVLEQMARDHSTLTKVANRHDIRRKIK